MADRINWSEIEYFEPDEFSESPDECAQPRLIYTLDGYRGLLAEPFHPSPAKGALARFDNEDKDSRHFCSRERRSDAIDGFPRGNPVKALMVALTCQLWGGVGLYLDTHYSGRDWPMLHLDLRPLGHGHSQRTALVWVRSGGNYTYPQYEDGGAGLLLGAMRAARRMQGVKDKIKG